MTAKPGKQRRSKHFAMNQIGEKNYERMAEFKGLICSPSRSLDRLPPVCHNRK